MKTSAIVRIVLYSLLLLTLISLLIGGIYLHKFVSGLSNWVPSGKETVTERSVSADAYSKIEIEWVGGSITVKVGGSDKIIIKETKDSSNPYVIATEYDDDTLKIQYGNRFLLNFGNQTGKDLTIIVPQNWTCKELTINGTALEIGISGLTVDSLDLDGAATVLNFNGVLGQLECDGAAAELNLSCTNSPDEISIDGAACKLDLTLPANTGYRVDADGLAIDFSSNCAYTSNDGVYIYGTGSCQIDISGVGCEIDINELQ